MGKYILLLICLLNLNGIEGQTLSEKEGLPEWWKDARFGLFIHWDPVTRTGGEISWSREQYGISKYDSLYLGFNPIKFNASEWVELAKKAGMKYIMFTTKHHAGFCMWNTLTTKYNIINTPFGRDVCKELADAAHKARIPIGWYFSLGDWKDQDCRFPRTNKNPITNDKFEKRLLDQIRELMTNYGKISLLWFDFDGSPCPSKPKEIYDLVKKLQPGIIVNNRLDVFHTDESTSRVGPNGDYASPEGFVPGYGAIPWETADILGHQWSWKMNDTPRPVGEVATMLLRCAGGNGNLLLNVGPDSLGVIPENFQSCLIELGEWLKPRAYSIYNTRGGPYSPTKEYVCTFNNKTLYLNILAQKGDTLTLPALSANIKNAYLISGKEVNYIQQKNSLKIIVPAADREKIATLITINTHKPLNQIGLIRPFSSSGSLAYGCSASASSSMGQFVYDPAAAFDDNPETYWKLGRKHEVDFSSYYGKVLWYLGEEIHSLYDNSGWLEVDLGNPKTVQSIYLSEFIYQNSIYTKDFVIKNSEIKDFEVQYEKDGKWLTIAGSTKMGEWKRNIIPVTARKFRLVILDTDGFPGINEFQLYSKKLTDQ